jgi:UDP-N-acetylmuramyl pentapeptide phosphotransferase/UDP-N-acetylglucosamine-1-phosphate transferase
MIIPTAFFGTVVFEHELKYIIISLLILFFIGIKDDILVISPRKKLIAEIFAISIVVILGDIRVSSFHGFLGIDVIPYVISIVFTIFMFIVIINGFNLIDGIDGLASGVGIFTMLSLGIWFLLIKDYSYAAFCFSTVGALLAFFRFNVFSRKNKIFLGDTGSLIVGLVVTIFVVKFLESSLKESFASIYQSAPAIAIGLLIVPLIDTLRVFTMRIIQGISPFKADRSHIHHRLLMLNLNHRTSSFIILGFNLFIILLSLALRHLGNIKVLLIILPLSVFLTSIPSLILRYRERRRISQHRYLGENSWILPSTIVDSIVSLKMRNSKKHRPEKSFYAYDGGKRSLNNGRHSLEDIEPMLVDTYLRYISESEEIEPAEIEEVKD